MVFTTDFCLHCLLEKVIQKQIIDNCFQHSIIWQTLKAFSFPVPRESADVNWDFRKVTLSDEGFYECIAVSSAGTGRAQTFFDVSGNFPLSKSVPMKMRCWWTPKFIQFSLWLFVIIYLLYKIVNSGIDFLPFCLCIFSCTTWRLD